MKKTMHRKTAIELISKHDVGNVPYEERKTTIECAFLTGFDLKDDEIQSYPHDLQQELCNQQQEYDFTDSRYDPIIVNDIQESYVGAKNEYILEKLKKIKPEESEIEGDAEKLFECRCCHYLTLTEDRSYDICSVCFWEDDGATEEKDYSGPNHQTLGEGRKNFAKLGACDETSREHVDPDGIYKYHRRST